MRLNPCRNGQSKRGRLSLRVLAGASSKRCPLGWAIVAKRCFLFTALSYIWWEKMVLEVWSRVFVTYRVEKHVLYYVHVGPSKTPTRDHVFQLCGFQTPVVSWNWRQLRVRKETAVSGRDFCLAHTGNGGCIAYLLAGKHCLWTIYNLFKIS